MKWWLCSVVVGIGCSESPIAPLNHPPVAIDDMGQLETNTTLSLDVVANDQDPDGDPLAMVSHTSPAHGSVTFAGTVATYTPELDFRGSDSFSYTIDDGRGGTSSAAVDLEVVASAIAGSIDSKWKHTCVVRSDRSLWCWGENDWGELGDGSTTTRPTPVEVGMEWLDVAAGHHHTCAVRSDRTLWCWGQNQDGQLGNGLFETMRPTPTQIGTESWKAVTAGLLHTCAIRDDDSLWCWGGNGSGMLGDGTTDRHATPQLIAPAMHWKTVAAGDLHGCAIDVLDGLWCWGAGGFGQIGNGATQAINSTPVPIEPGTQWLAIGAGEEHTCSTRLDGSLWCWGGNLYGEVGDGTTTQRDRPTRVGTLATWNLLGVGGKRTCATQTDGSLWCFGFRNRAGQSDATQNQLVPAQVSTTSRFTTIAGGAVHHCGIDDAGEVACWGRNESAALGTGRFADKSSPSNVVAALGWRGLESGGDSSCGIQLDGSLWCWGSNMQGALGTGTTDHAAVPVRVGTDTDWLEVSTGGGHTCALRSDQTLWCWGNNSFGQIGDGTNLRRLIPTRVGTATWTAIAVGGSFTCATRSDRTLWCWGANDNGQLGIGSVQNRNTPTQVGTAATWLVPNAGPGHVCATRTDGSLWCWGYGTSGQLGNGTTTAINSSPIRVGLGTQWASVATGGAHTCAIQADGSLWCWGSNGSGEVGNGMAPSTEPSPVQVTAGASWETVATGTDFTCATRTDHTVYCWGFNGGGQFGNGMLMDRVSTPLLLDGVVRTQLAAGLFFSCSLASTGAATCSGSNIIGELGDGDSWSDVPVPVAL